MAGIFRHVVVLALVACTSGFVAADEVHPSDSPACVDPSSDIGDAETFVAKALEVLRSCGHEPADYRLELHQDDPFVAVSARRDPVHSAVFLPLDHEPHYPIAVRSSHPCVVSWIWQQSDFTDWQRQVVARAEESARTSDLPWAAGRSLNISVTESLEYVGVEVFDPEAWRDGSSSELRVLMHKEDLSLVESD